MQRSSFLAELPSFDEAAISGARNENEQRCKYGHRRISAVHAGRAFSARHSHRSSRCSRTLDLEEIQDRASAFLAVPVSSTGNQYSHMHGRRQLHYGHSRRTFSTASSRPLARFGEFGPVSRNSLRPSPVHRSPQSVTPERSSHLKRKAELQMIVDHAVARKQLKRSPLTPRRESSPILEVRPTLPARASTTRLPKINSRKSSSSSAQSYSSALSSLSSVQSFASSADEPNGIRFGPGASRANFGIGLINVGNTCFINASLQILIHMNSMTQYLERHARRDCMRKRLLKPGTSAENECLVCSLKDLYAARCQNGKSAKMLMDEGASTQHEMITPIDFVNSADEKYLERRFKPSKLIQWKRRIQQDAQEYLMSYNGLLVELQKHLVGNNRTDFTKKLFSGAWQGTTRCMTPGCTDFYVASEQLSDVFQIQLPLGESANDLRSLLQGYFAAETIDGDNGWNCPSCQRKTTATRTHQVRQAPKILVIHLKRFEMTFAGTKRDGKKIQDPVRLPPSLSLSKYLAAEHPKISSYKLSGVLCHHGKNVDDGHYTSYVENQGTWAHFDDLNEACPVRLCDAKEVLRGKDSYVIFYEMTNNRK